MRTAGRKLAVAASVLAAWVAVADAAYEDRPAAKRALYTGIAMVANVVPVGLDALCAAMPARLRRVQDHVRRDQRRSPPATSSSSRAAAT